MPSLVQIADFDPSTRQPEDYVVFGGTFDPIHEGHVNAVRRLARLFPLVIVAPTSQNPWKLDQAQPVPFALRVAMIQLALDAEEMPHIRDLTDFGIAVADKEYIYAEDAVRYFRALRPGKLYWACGEDIAHTIQHWRNWETLGVTTIVVPIEIDTHSTLV
ncbi:MAG TPA: adenylyltransferase/cytidyltransferase family protein, partial [Oligoflexia bacterium]|nr:adenylyltransferase/cytidyltransferase family protein [Oligoflexia bacterium]